MTILITGANGFTGAHVARIALKKGIDVHGYVRESSDLNRLNGLKIKLFKGDITDAKTILHALENVDTVIHTAAYVALGAVDQAEMERVNVEGTRTVLATSLAAGVKRFVYCSTIGIFGDTKGEIVTEEFQRDQSGFSSTYDSSKFYAQKLVDSYLQKGLEVISILPSGIMGRGDPHFGPVISRYLSGRLKLWAGGQRLTGIVHVEDVANSLLLAAQKGRAGEKYIVSAGELRTIDMFAILARGKPLKPPKEVPEIVVRAVAQLLEITFKIVAKRPPLNRELVHYLYDRCVRVDATKARNELGWRPLSPEQIVLTLIP